MFYRFSENSGRVIFPHLLLISLLHRKFTRLPHLAGTEQNLRYAEQIRDEWLQFGLDSVELVPYDVLLSYPKKSQPNYISILDGLGREVPRLLSHTWTPAWARRGPNATLVFRICHRQSAEQQHGSFLLFFLPLQ